MTLFEISLYQFLQTFYNLLISVPPSIKVTKLSKTMPAPAATENSSNQTTADAAAPPQAAPLQRKKSVSKSAQTDSESSIEEISVLRAHQGELASMSQPSMQHMLKGFSGFLGSHSWHIPIFAATRHIVWCTL